MQAIETQDKQFHDGNGTTELGTILPAWWLNQVQSELLGVLTAANIAPNKAKTNQLAEAIQKLFPSKNFTLTAGAGLTGGGDLSANRTIGLATPSTLSGSTTNWAGNGATGHTHEIAKATPTLAGVVKLVNGLDSTATDAALTAAQGKALAEQIAAANANSVTLTGDQTIAGTKTFSGSLNTNAEIRAGGMVSASYRNDWVGFLASQPTEGKHGFFDVTVNGVMRGGLQIIADGGGKYSARIMVTPAGATDTDRRVSGMTVYDGSIYTHAYGWLHEGFIRNGTGAGQSSGHQISLGWSSGGRLKAQVDATDLGNIVFDSHFAAQHGQSGYQKLPNGLIIQWGKGTSGKAGVNVTNRFPIAFPTSCANVQAIHIGEDYAVNVIVNSVTLTGFNSRSSYQVDQVSIYWFAIGY